MSLKNKALNYQDKKGANLAKNGKKDTSEERDVSMTSNKSWDGATVKTLPPKLLIKEWVHAETEKIWNVGQMQEFLVCQESL